MIKIPSVIITNLILLMAVVISASAQADKPRSEVEVSGIYTIPSGSVNLSGTTPNDTTVDFSRDLDLQNRWGYGLKYIYRSESGKHKLWASYTHTSNTNTGLLNRSIIFGGRVYIANVTTRSDTSLGIFLASYAYRWGNDKIRIGPMGQLGWATTKVGLNAVGISAGGSREGSISSVAGTVGYDMDYDPNPKVNIYNNVGFMALSGERFLRGEIGLKYYFVRAFGINGGYQFGNYKLKKNQNFIDARENGPFIGGVLRF
jgi:hypothetical protein